MREGACASILFPFLFSESFAWWAGAPHARTSSGLNPLAASSIMMVAEPSADRAAQK